MLPMVTGHVTTSAPIQTGLMYAVVRMDIYWDIMGNVVCNCFVFLLLYKLNNSHKYFLQWKKFNFTVLKVWSYKSYILGFQISNFMALVLDYKAFIVHIYNSGVWFRRKILDRKHSKINTTESICQYTIWQLPSTCSDLHLVTYLSNVLNVGNVCDKN